MVQIGCILLAAGASTRFGPPDKLTVGQYPLAERAMDSALAADFCEYGVVVSRQETALLAARRKMPWVINPAPQRGIYSSVALGAGMARNAEAYLFAVADQPRMSADILRAMKAAYERGTILRAACGEKRGNPVIFPRELLPELMQLRPGESGRTVAKRHASLIRNFETGDEQALEDADTPEALFRLLEVRRFVIRGRSRFAAAALAGAEPEEERQDALLFGQKEGKEFVFDTERQEVADCAFLLKKFLQLGL